MPALLGLGVDLALVLGLVLRPHPPHPQRPRLRVVRGVVAHHRLEAQVRRVRVPTHREDAQLLRRGDDPRELQGKNQGSFCSAFSTKNGNSALGFELAIPYRRGIFHVARLPKAFVKSKFGYLAGEEQA